LRALVSAVPHRCGVYLTITPSTADPAWSCRPSATITVVCDPVWSIIISKGLAVTPPVRMPDNEKRPAGRSRA
jgi:hypothetical protein